MPGFFDGRGQGGGTRDGEAQVGGRDGFAGGGVEVGGEVLVGGQQAGVDGGDDGEEGDFLLGGGVGVGEEGGGETLPDGVGVEGEHELDGAAGEEGSEDGVDGAVDVVQREHVEEVVGGGVFPGVDEGAGLGGHDGLGDQYAFLYNCQSATSSR